MIGLKFNHTIQYIKERDLLILQNVYPTLPNTSLTISIPDFVSLKRERRNKSSLKGDRGSTWGMSCVYLALWLATRDLGWIFILILP